MPNVMVALPNIGGALWLTPTTRVPCSNAAKTQNPLQLPGVPPTNETISAEWAEVHHIVGTCRVDIAVKFFFRLSIHALVAKI